MQKPKVNPAIVIAGAVLVICLAVFLIFRQATSPSETINYDYKKIPPKGAAAQAGRTGR